MDIRNTECPQLLATYGRALNEKDMGSALRLVELMAEADRTDALVRLRHKPFLRLATEKQAVEQAMRFVELLPAASVDVRTYNMLLTVCVRARDVPAALRATEMMKSAGLRMDTTIYTSLMQACTKAPGRSEEVMALYRTMVEEGLRLDVEAYTTVVASIAATLAELSRGEPRGRLGPRLRQALVLLEQAFQVLQNMREDKLQPDRGFWNSLLLCTARCQQLDRALQVVEEMQTSGCTPDARTYAILIHACRLTDNRERALAFYRRALREGHTKSLQIYSAAISACYTPTYHQHLDRPAGVPPPPPIALGRPPPERGEPPLTSEPDLESAMKVYADMQAAGVHADSRLYGMLMAIAGASGRLDAAFALEAQMEGEGLEVCSACCSGLIAACIHAGRVEEAWRVYTQMKARGIFPHQKQFNNLIHACACNHQLGNVVRIVQDLRKAGLRPDAMTFAAVLGGCQREGASDLVMHIVPIMQASGVAIDRTICFVLLRTAYNRLREMWHPPNGYPPSHTKGKAGSWPAAPGGAAEARMGSGSGFPGPGAGTALGSVTPGMPGWGSRLQQQRESMRPGSLRPGVMKVRWAGTPEGLGLLEALQGSPLNPGQLRQCDELSDPNWISWAIAVYRDAVAGGMKPDLYLLDRLLAILRQPMPSAKQRLPGPSASMRSAAAPSIAPLRPPAGADGDDPAAGRGWGGRPWAIAQHRLAGSGDAGGAAREPEPEHVTPRRAMPREESVFDPRAVVLLEEAVALGVVPSFHLHKRRSVLDLRGMPPTVAEVYVMAVFLGLYNRLIRGEQDLSFAIDGNALETIVFKIPDMDPEQVFWTSLGEQAPGPPVDRASAVNAPYVADSRTGLAAAGQLRNMGIFGVIKREDRLIIVPGHIINAWLRRHHMQVRLAKEAEKRVGNEQRAAGRMWKQPLTMQQRSIRAAYLQ